MLLVEFVEVSPPDRCSVRFPSSPGYLSEIPEDLALDLPAQLRQNFTE